MSKNILAYFPAGQMKPKGPHEFAGACPLCGGATNDGFIVWPDRPRGGAFLCRKCGASGDGIAFLMQRDGLTYAEACAALGIEPKRTATGSFPARRVHARPRPVHLAQVAPVPPAPAELPCPEWMASASTFLDDCQSRLETSPEALLAITGRFLTPYTAQDCGIGWNPADRYILRESWGLPVIEMADGGKRDKLLLPRGLVIATRREAGTVAITIRCSDDRPESRPKFWQVKGSSNVPFVAGRAGLPLLLVESALDAALVWQESFGKLAAVAFMGSTKPADDDTDQFIKQAPLLLAAPDRDDAGEKAWARWSATYRHAHFAPVLFGKDLGEQHAAAHTWPLDYAIPTTGEWLTAVLSALSNDATACLENAHTSRLSFDSMEGGPMCGNKQNKSVMAA